MLHKDLKHLSLQQNRLRELPYQFGSDEDQGNDGYKLKSVVLYTLDLSSNQFDKFPYYALSKQRKMIKIDLSRNKITKIPSDLDFNVFRRM